MAQTRIRSESRADRCGQCGALVLVCLKRPCRDGKSRLIVGAPVAGRKRQIMLVGGVRWVEDRVEGWVARCGGDGAIL